MAHELGYKFSFRDSSSRLGEKNFKTDDLDSLKDGFIYNAMTLHYMTSGGGDENKT